MADSIFLRDEGGGVQKFDLPLHPAIAHRLEKGEMLRVADEDGRPWVDPALPEAPEVVAARDLKAEVEDLRQQLADVTRERDEAVAQVVEQLTAAPDPEVSEPPAPTPAKAAKAKPGSS